MVQHDTIHIYQIANNSKLGGKQIKLKKKTKKKERKREMRE